MTGWQSTFTNLSLFIMNNYSPLIARFTFAKRNHAAHQRLLDRSVQRTHAIIVLFSDIFVGVTTRT